MQPNEATESLHAVRERMVTIPADLSEYAWNETGPTSWSAADVPRVQLSPSDIVRLAQSPGHLVPRLTLCEAAIVASIDGQSTLETIIHGLDMPEGEALTIVCELCAAGVLVAA
jgi:hypothetical protein